MPYNYDPLHNLPRRQCIAITATGSRCKMPPQEGSTVCRIHNDPSSKVQQKANMRLMELIDGAITVLAQEMVQAEKSADRQKAANSILDRAGIARRIDTPDSSAARALLMERIASLHMSDEQHTAPNESQETAESRDIVDAEIVEDEPTPRDFESSKEQLKQQLLEAAAQRAQRKETENE